MGTQNDGNPKGSKRVASAGSEILNERGRLAQPSQEIQKHGISIAHVLLVEPLGITQAAETRAENTEGHEQVEVH